MRQIIHILLALLIINNFSVTSTYANNQTSQNTDSIDYSKFTVSQQELNHSASNEFKQADNTLNIVYNQIRTEYGNDKAFTDKLVDAELAWIAFRDAELGAIYPAENKQRYGSVFPMTYAKEKTGLTLSRAKQLKEWLEGLPIGQSTGSTGIDYSKYTSTQQNINYLVEESKRADDTLNDVYNQILILYQNDKIFIDKLIDAELAWIAFRDAELEAVTTAQNKQNRYGSFYTMAYELEKTRLTWARVEQLKKWSEGIPEGVVGAGSRRIR